MFWKCFYSLVKNSPKLTWGVLQMHLIQEGCDGRFVLISCTRRGKTCWNAVWASPALYVNQLDWLQCLPFTLKKKKSPAKLFNSVTDFLGIWRVYVLFVFVWFFSLFVVCLFVWGVFCFCFSSPKSSLILLAPLAISVGKVNETTWDIGKIFRKQRGILYLITTEIQKKWFLFSLQAFFLFRVKFDG